MAVGILGSGLDGVRGSPTREIRRGPVGGAGEGDEAATEIRRRSGRGRGGVVLVDDVQVARCRL